MRTTLTLLLLIVFLGVTTPAEAQLRTDVRSANAPVKLYDQGGSAFSLNKYFSPEHFRMSHSVEFSTSSFNGGSSMGMYTNSMMWQFSQKLAARVDVGVAYSPNAQGFGQSNKLNLNNGPQVFLRNAEIAYRPSENVQFHLSVRQSPYGQYASPYGYYGHRGGGHFQAAFGHDQRDLFWNDRLR